MKKTTRILSLLFCILLLAGIFASCGSSAKSEDAAAEPASPQAPAPAEVAGGSGFELDYTNTSLADGAAGLTEGNSAVANRKLIYTYDLYIETLDYNAAIASIPSLATSYGGYVESSYVESSGINYENNYRHATYTLRIPGEQVAAFVASCGDIGVITSQYCNTDDKTTVYIDLSARLDTLEIEEDTLNGLLANADSMDTIVALNARLSEVRYEIESIESSLRSIDSLVELSTVNLELYEVTKVSHVSDEAPKSFAERLSARISRSYDNFMDEIEDIGIYLLGEFPLQLVLFLIYIIPFVIVVIILLLILRGVRRRRRAKKSPVIPADLIDSADEDEPEAKE